MTGFADTGTSLPPLSCARHCRHPHCGVANAEVQTESTPLGRQASGVRSPAAVVPAAARAGAGGVVAASSLALPRLLRLAI